MAQQLLEIVKRPLCPNTKRAQEFTTPSRKAFQTIILQSAMRPPARRLPSIPQNQTSLAHIVLRQSHYVPKQALIYFIIYRDSGAPSQWPSAHPKTKMGPERFPCRLLPSILNPINPINPVNPKNPINPKLPGGCTQSSDSLYKEPCKPDRNSKPKTLLLSNTHRVALKGLCGDICGLYIRVQGLKY